MTNESSSDELGQEKNRSKLRRNKHKDNKEGVEALLRLRHQQPRNIDKSRPLRIDWPRSGPVRTVAFFGDRLKRLDRTVQHLRTAVRSQKY